MVDTCYIKFPRVQRPKDRLTTPSLHQEFIKVTYIAGASGQWQNSMDIFHATWQALKDYIG